MSQFNVPVKINGKPNPEYRRLARLKYKESGNAAVRKWQEANIDYRKEKQAQRYKDNPEAYANQRYIYKYGITLQDYRKMVESQGGVCKICGGPPNGKHLKLVVDHCHTSGLVRGLLCSSCNKAIGLMRDDVEILKKAIFYLEN